MVIYLVLMLPSGSSCLPNLALHRLEVYLFPDVTAGTRGLLPHDFTLTPHQFCRQDRSEARANSPALCGHASLLSARTCLVLTKKCALHSKIGAGRYTFCCTCPHTAVASSMGRCYRLATLKGRASHGVRTFLPSTNFTAK